MKKLIANSITLLQTQKKSSLIILFLWLATSAATLPDSLRVTVTADGETQTLHLHKRTARSADYAIKQWDSSGYTDITPLPEVRTFRGTIDENPNAIVYAMITSSGTITAKCIDQEWGHGYRWSISEDIASQLSAPIAATAMPVQPQAWPKSGSNGTPNVGLKVPTGTSGTGVDYGILVDAELAMDITNNTYTSKSGNIVDIVATYELEGLLYDMIMTRDALMRIKLSQMVIRTVPFYANPGQPGLGEMNTEWKKEPLFSTPWDMVWASNGWYGMGNSIGKNEYSMSAGAMHHENGHNWGAFHLAYMADIMGGNKPNHGPMTVEVVRKKRTEKIDEGDLTAGVPFEDPLHPHTHVDLVRTEKGVAVDIDVLANDWDSNGDSLFVSSFTTTTETGGSVTLNLDGTLRYTPAANFAGKDIIVYVAEESSNKGLKSRDVVHIEVVNNGLMLHYTFDETTGTVVSDASGVGLAGDLNGADFATHSVQSPLGKGVKVYGRQNENQIENGDWSGVIVGNGDVMPVELNASRHASPFEEEYNRHSGYYDPMNGDYSFATWFKFDNYNSAGWNSWGHYIASKWWHMETRVGWDLQAIDGKLTLHWRIFDGATGIQTLSANCDLVEGQWYHATAVFDQTKNEARIYLDGQVVATKTNAFASHSYIFNGRAPLCLGSFADESGYLDDVRIYAKALDDNTVDSLYSLARAENPTFFVDTIIDTILIGTNYFSQIAPHLWHGGDKELTYAGQGVPAWLTLSSEGYLIGAPTIDEKGTYTFTVRATNSTGASDEAIVQLVVNRNGLNLEYWNALSGGTIADLTGYANYPATPDKDTIIKGFDIPRDIGSSYGARVRGYLLPPTTGDYTFYVASDDAGELWLSSDEDEQNKVNIASVTGYTGYQQWDKYSSQKSIILSLEAGKRYYIEALFKEDGGGDHLSVAWEGPGITQQVIANEFLELFELPQEEFVLDHHLPLDETEGTVLNDVVGTLTGTVFGAPDLAISGATTETGTALAFDGADDSVSLSIEEISGPWTLTMWVKNQKSSGISTLFRTSSYALKLRQDGTGKLGMTKFGSADYSFDYTLPLDEWVYITITCDGSSTTNLWIDGELISSIPKLNLPLSRMGGTSTYAQIDDIKIYRQFLDKAMMQQILNENNHYTSQVIVPDLTALTQADGENLLTENALNTGVITEEYSTTVPVGHIISQSPVSGVVVDEESSVAITVSLGVVTAITQKESDAPSTFADLMVAPNPVKLSSEGVNIHLPSNLSGAWHIAVYDVLGNVVDEAHFSATERTTYHWDLHNIYGAQVSNGSYILIASFTSTSGIKRLFKKVIGVKK